MTITELIKEAQERYPIGTIFRAAHISNGSKCDFKVLGNWREFSNGHVVVDAENVEESNGFTPLLFTCSGNRWAKILSLPEPEVPTINNNYSII